MSAFTALLLVMPLALLALAALAYALLRERER